MNEPRLRYGAFGRATEWSARTIAAPFVALGGAAAGLIWPARSLLSEERVDRPGMIEAPLWASLTFLHAPCCAACGFPFEVDQGTDALCLACTARRPAFDRARAALAYDEISRRLVLELKHGGRRDGLPTFAAWLKHAAPFAPEADLIAPVPLHYLRLVRRGFNQSAWLAAGLAKAAGRPFAPQLLRRAKPTPTQGGLTASGRARNVRGAFRVHPRDKPRLAGARILLVDDVFTTGATVEACARTLKRAGAKTVDVVCLARVVRAADPLI